MRFTFSIPTQRKPTKDSFPTTSRKIQHWLSTLEPEALETYQRQLYRGLKHYNRLIVEPKERIEGLEMIRPRVEHIGDALASIHTDQPLPLPRSALEALHQHQNLLKEMAFGYKICVNDALNETSHPPEESLTLAIERAMSYLSDLIVVNAQHYFPAPKNTWCDLKALFMAGHRLGTDEHPVVDLLSPTAQQQNCLAVFKRILLFALANPHTLHIGEARKLWQQLLHWSPGARLEDKTPAKQDMFDGGVFCINMDSDSAPERPDFVDRETQSPLLWLDTRGVIQSVQRHKQARPNLAHPVCEGNNLHTETYASLQKHWLGQSERKEARGIRNQSCSAAFGLKDIVTIYRYNNTHETPYRSPSEQPWTLINYSKNGFGLSWQALSSTRARVGNLTALEVDGQWHLSVIRWLQFKHEHQFHCGAEVLSGTPRAVVIERLYPDQPRSENTRHEALLLAPGKDLLTSLILPTDNYRAGEKVQLFHADQSASEAHLVECLTVGGDFVRFAVHIRSL